MRRIAFGVALLASCLATAPAAACHSNPSCTAGTFINGVNTYVCDKICFTATDCITAGTFNNCDQCGSPADPETPDGKCTICNVGGHAATLTGTSGNDVVCGGPLNDAINGNGGSDIIEGGAGNDSISGGSGVDEISGGMGNDSLFGDSENDIIIDGLGNNYVDGGSGADLLWTGAGDDEVHGGTGNDTIIGGGGADYLDGGADNDSLSSIVYGATSTPDDDLGTRYCGGAGNDNLQARGPAHQCMDGGDGTDTCGYAFFVSTRSPTNFDVGTATGCESMPGVVSTRQPACGCP